MITTSEGDVLCCAYCRHWMLGTINPEARVEARKADKRAPCHVWQNTTINPDGLGAADSCAHYEQIVMRGVKRV